MSRIPAPSYENHSYNAGSLSMAHTSAYTGMGGADPMAAYSQQLHRYINDMKRRYSSTTDGTFRSEIQRNLNLAYSYMQMIGEEMPMDSAMGGSDWPLMGGAYSDPYGGIPEQGMGAGRSLGASPSFQDSNKVIYEDAVSSLTASKAEAREQRFYDRGEVEFNIPGSANARVTSETIDGRQAIVVNVTWSSDGSSRRYVFFNDKVKIVSSATNPADQVTLVAPLPEGKVELKSKDATETRVRGDEPTRVEGGKRIWDASSAEIYSRNDGKENDVVVRERVKFHASSNSEYWTVAWEGGRYVVKVYDHATDRTAAHLKETFNVDDMADALSFDIESSHIEFLGELGDAADRHQLNSSNEHAIKISIGTGREAGRASRDTQPDETDTAGRRREYNRSANVERTARFDGFTNDLSLPGTATIHTSSYADKVEVVKNADGSFTVKVYKDGIIPPVDPNHVEQFNIQGPPTKIIIDALPDRVFGSGKTDPLVQIGTAPRASTAPSGDATPTETSADGVTATYSTEENVQITNNFDDTAETHRVSLPGEFKLIKKNYGDTFEITKNADGTYTIYAYKDGITVPGPGYKREQYIVSGPPSKITIDALPDKVKYRSAPGGTLQAFNPTMDSRIRVGAGGEDESDAVTWPFGQLVANVPSGGDDTDKALVLAQKIEEAIRSRNWTDVNSYINTLNANNGNNVVRKVITGLFRAAGSDQTRFMALLRMVDPGTLDLMKRKVMENAGESGEIQTGDQWHSAGAAAQITASQSA